MSRRLSKFLRRGVDEGFTLVEVLVAMSIFAVAAAALLPLLIVSAKAASVARLETQAKNLSQQQVERMRNLAFHVAHQNGDYVDMLDLYYTNTLGSASALTPSSVPRASTAYQDADGNVIVQFFADTGGAGGAPSGAAYRVSDLQFVGYPGFTLDVYTQFLNTTRTVATPPATYDSQMDGADAPPTQLAGITVITTWSSGGKSESYRTYTEFADGGSTTSLQTTQARATALRINGTDMSGNVLLAQAGVVQADGSVTSGSRASAAAEGARLEQVGVASQLGANASVAAPPNPAGSTGTPAAVAAKVLNGVSANPCGWSSMGSTQVSNVSASTGIQQPQVPSDGGTDVAAPGAKRVQSGVLVGSSGCSGYNFRYSPDADGLWLPPALYGIDGSKPLAAIRDSSGSSTLSNAAALATGQVTASQLVTAPIFSSSYASARTKSVEMLPVTGYTNGLVQAQLTSSSVACRSGAATSAAYSLQVTHPGGTSLISWSNASATPPIALPDPSTITFTVGGVPHNLGEYLSWSVASQVSEGTNGVSSFGPVLRVTLHKAVTGTTTDTTIEMGVLSCVADDRR